MAKSKADQESLLQVLKSLLTTNHQDTDSVPFVIFDCKYGYIMHYVPANVKHPLKDIVGNVRDGYLLVSKLPETAQNQNQSYEDDETETNKQADLDLTLPVVTQYHVYVGTPITQKIHQLLHQRDLHSQESTEVEKSIDISSLEKLHITHARYFLSLYAECQRFENNLPEIWLLCNQNNHQGVTFMGMVPQSMVAGTQKTDGKLVSTVLVRCKDLDNNVKDGLVLGDEKKKHLQFNKAAHAETHGYARYHVYGTPDSLTKDVGCPESTITMEFAWDGVSKILQKPPPSGNAVLNIRAHPEDVRDVLMGVSKELDALVNHFTVVQRKLSTNENEDGDEVKDEEEIYSDDEVLEFLEKLKHNDFGKAELMKGTSVGESPAANVAVPFGIGEALQRQDLDNTEHLWLFLKDSKSENKIVFCLELIMSALLEGKYHPVLHAANHTHIAKLMKEVFCCKTDAEKVGVKAKITNAFNTTTALQCIVDIGLEKLRNDYTNYFIQQELITKDKLEYYLAQDIPTSEKIQRLLKLHCILSLVALAIAYAHVNYDGLRKLVAAALFFYKEHSYNEHPLFSLSLPAFSASSSNIKNVCVQKFQPQIWLVAITTMNEHITVIEVEACDQLQESFLNQDKSFQNSYVTTTATVQNIHL